jgi:uncharacterized membrane protein YeaQ/YmgE (transglycosylase-associated protein family)
MGIIAWIVLGLVVGIIAKTLLGGREKHGIIITILIGVAGALLAGWAAPTIFHIDTNQGFFNITTWISAIVGSAVVLLIYNAVTGNSGSRRPLRRRARR